MGKTPQFDKALDEILSDLKPHKGICKTCRVDFEIFVEDIEVYHKLRVPPPTLCPLCRMQRRMALSLRLPPFYKKSCTVPGHTEKVVSLFPESSPHQVYDNVYWRSDGWDALDYGREYQPHQDFSPQFKVLFFRVPHQALFVDPQSVNSEYTIGGIASKNCYYVGAPLYSENIIYAFAPTHSRDSVDVVSIYESELLYESIYCHGCYNCNFCMESVNCRDSWFLYDCHNCDNCFLSANLRNKSYYFLNRQLTKGEYEKKLKSLRLGRRSVLTRLKKEFAKLYHTAIHRFADTKHTVNSIGDKIFDCNKCYWVFDASENCENLRFVEHAIACKDSSDVVGFDHSSLTYEASGIGSGSHILFSVNLRNCSFTEYSAYCRDSNYCFGSVGLRSKNFCVFNRQYGEKDYWKKLDTIKTEMLRRGEYGEFFSMALGLIPYQNTYAQREFPLDQEKATERGMPWYEDKERALPAGIEILDSGSVPDEIQAVGDDILEKGILCEVTGKPFRIVKPELEFYRKKGLPLPVRHPDQRMRERFDQMNRFRLWQYPCSKCGQQMYTPYNPEKKLKVYCESCYLKEGI